MKEKFTNLYNISKTLRFSLIPVGTTAQTFEKMNMLEQDKKLADSYELVKSYIDRYHRRYIDAQLSKTPSETFTKLLDEYFRIYRTKDKNEEQMQNTEEKLRKQISKQLKESDVYKNQLFKQGMIKTLLPDVLEDEDEKRIVGMFEKFTTYFSNFTKNRENMYSEKNQVTSIAHRCINDNLPRFIDNCDSFKHIYSALDKADIDQLKTDMLAAFDFCAVDIFKDHFFAKVLPQSGIDTYNAIIGDLQVKTGQRSRD